MADVMAGGRAAGWIESVCESPGCGLVQEQWESCPARGRANVIQWSVVQSVAQGPSSAAGMTAIPSGSR